jgi:hypothetical protein
MSEQTQTIGKAVRWAGRYYGDQLDFTVWHYARSERSTGCGRQIPERDDLLALETAPARRTSCKQCLNRHEVKEALKGEA